MFSWAMLAVAIVAARDGTLPSALLRSPAVVLTALLACWLVVRLSTSAAPAYGSQKVQLFVLINVGALVGGAVIGRTARDFGLFLRLMLAVGAVSALVLTGKLAGGGAQQVAGDRYVIASTYDPIAFGRSMGFALLVAVFLLASGATAKLRTAAVVLLPVLALAFFAAGSRGPLVGLAGGLLVLAGLSVGTKEARRRLSLLVPVGLVAGFAVSRLVPGQSVTRIFSFLTGNGSDTRGEARLTLWHAAWQAFGDHPLAGLGTGGFAALDPANVYPHNLLLETASELGLPGLFLVLALIAVGTVTAARAWREGTRRLEAAFVLALLATATINAMFSADIGGNGQIWLALGLATGIGGRLGQRRHRERAPEPCEPEPEPRHEPSPVDPGAVTEPPDGAVVAGRVRLVASPARTGWGVAAVRFQVSRDGGAWTDVAYDDAGYDVIVRTGDDAGHVAVVRSRRLAEALARVLRSSGSEVDLRPARSHRWEHGRHVGAVWDTSEIEPGAYWVRAATRDLTGAVILSQAIGVTVREAPPAGPPDDAILAPDERAAPVAAAPVEDPVRAPEPEPLPPVVVRQPLPVPSGRIRLDELDRLVQQNRDPDPYVQDEREARVHQLRSFIEPDGTIPRKFDALVDDVFGPLLARR
jgi:O-antigen ligase